MSAKQHQMHVPLDVLQTPCSGECVVGAYWMVHPEKGALYVLDDFRASSPHDVREVYNYDKRIVERFLQEDHVAMQIPVAYLIHGRRAAPAFQKEVRELIESRRFGVGKVVSS